MGFARRTGEGMEQVHGVATGAGGTEFNDRSESYGTFLGGNKEIARTVDNDPGGICPV